MRVWGWFTTGALKVTMLMLSLGIFMMYSVTADAAPQYALNCNSCHSMPPLDSGTAKKNPNNGAIPGNHQGHATAAVTSCVKCHSTANNDVTAYVNSHRNKTIEFSDALKYGRKPATPGFMNQSSVPPSPLGTCDNASCHSNGKGAIKITPAWGSLAFTNITDCSQCHAVAPATGNHPVSGSKHAAYFGTGTSSCATCHADHTAASKPFAHATSAGRGIEVKFAGGGSFDIGTAQCSNIICHSNGQSTKTFTTPSWGSTLTCAGCHGDSTSNTLSGKHASHVNNAAVIGTNFGCVTCHSATVSNNSTISDFAKHVDGTVNLVGTKVGVVSDGATCAVSTCHWDGKTTQKPVTWTQSATLGCDGCHGTAVTFGAPSYNNGGAGNDAANSHVKHATSAGTCVNCHSNTTTTGTAIIAGSQHTNGFINFTSGNGNTFGKQANKTCANISCHSGNGLFTSAPPAAWGATLECNGCHNIPTSATGSHVKHLAKAGITCEDCHTATAIGSTAIKSSALHVNGVVGVGGGIVTAFDGQKNCTTVCHNGKSPIWGNPGAGTVCGTCHSVGTPFATNFTQYNADDPALHNVHFGGTYGPNITIGATASGCASCHAFTDVNAANHDNLSINLDGSKVTGITNGSLTLALGNGGLTAKCDTCHTQSTAWKSSTSVGGARLACESCHNTAAPSIIAGKTAPDKPLAATSGHGKSGIAQACIDCHNNDSAHIGTGGTKRLFSNFTTSTAGAGCNSCHNDAAKVSARTLNMKVHQTTGLGSKCADCHNVHGTANSMMVNTTINGTAVTFSGNTTFANGAQTGVCQTCHTTTQYFTKAGVTPTTHLDSTTNCLECHKHNPEAGLAFAANGACNTCHGYPPAPKNVSGLAFGTQGQWSSARFEDYSGGGGAHLVAAHIAKDAKPGDAWKNCTPCHFGGSANHARALPMSNNVENVTVKVDPQFRFSDDAFIVYTGAKLVSGGANKSGGCFNVSCHMATSKPWSTER